MILSVVPWSWNCNDFLHEASIIGVRSASLLLLPSTCCWSRSACDPEAAFFFGFFLFLATFFSILELALVLTLVAAWITLLICACDNPASIASILTLLASM